MYMLCVTPGSDGCFEEGMLQRMGRGDTVDLTVREGFSGGETPVMERKQPSRQFTT